MKGIIICDIDGTIADMGKGKPGRRRPYDWDRVDEDDPIMPVIEIVKSLHEAGHEVLFVSGRMEAARLKTRRWLASLGLGRFPMFMRADGDLRPDVVVKREIFERDIKPLHTILAVLDDRNSVVAMWRELGLTVLQVAEGDF